MSFQTDETGILTFISCLLQELKNALSCKLVTLNAVNALQQCKNCRAAFPKRRQHPYSLGPESCSGQTWVRTTELCPDFVSFLPQELENALSCKYVASNAVNALQQVYQLLGSNPQEKERSLQSWARILLKPELGRIVEACQLLEQVAVEKMQLDGSYAEVQSEAALAVFALCCGMASKFCRKLRASSLCG